MLFRRPFAFLIKHFKMIHLALTIMIMYLLVQTNHIFRFIGEYMSSSILMIEPNVTTTLFKPFMTIVIIGIFALTFVILGLMSYKKKPVLFYIFNVLIYAFVSFTLVYCYTNLKILEIRLIEIKTLKLMQDFCLFSIMLQTFSVIIFGIRATGFNIKKFDFDEDLEDLKIADEDNEEFEIDMEFDTDLFKRTVRKKLRHAKYIYIENHSMIHLIILFILAIIGGMIFLNTGVYHKVYKEEERFSSSEFILNIKDSYITTSDYHQNTIVKGKKLLVIPYEVRSLSQVNKKMFKTARFTLKIGNQTFYDVDTYTEALSDIGNVYHGEYITTSFQKFILVYELPEKIKTDKIKLYYTDINNKVIEIAIHPVSDQNKTSTTVNLNQNIILDKTFLNKSIVKIDSYEIGESFSGNYNYCISNFCYIGVEHITPSISGTYNKVLLKLNGSFVPDENVEDYDFYKLLSDFGTITYEINGENKKIRQFQQVKPVNIKTTDSYYIEVPKELESADHITLTYTFRKHIYEIVVK